MNKTTQTSVNNSESSSSIDLTSINNDTFLINKTTNIKNKISSIFKQNKTSSSSDSTTNNESTDNKSSPIQKILSMSLKNFQANFIPSILSFSNNNNNNNNQTFLFDTSSERSDTPSSIITNGSSASYFMTPSPSMSYRT